MNKQKKMDDLDEYNDLQKMLTGERSLKKYLRSYGSLWKKKYTILKKDFNDAMVSAECMKSNHSTQDRPPTFKSRASSANGSRLTNLRF